MTPPSRLPPDWARLEGVRASADRLAERSAEHVAQFGFDAVANARPDGRGSEPGRPADRRPGMARLRGAGPHQAAR